jgi:hypothetical protein
VNQRAKRTRQAVAFTCLVRPEDPFFLKMNRTKWDTRTGRFEAILAKLGERLHQLMTSKQADEPRGGGDTPLGLTPTIGCFTAYQGNADVPLVQPLGV